jgi:hypothetical protein
VVSFFFQASTVINIVASCEGAILSARVKKEHVAYAAWMSRAALLAN